MTPQMQDAIASARIVGLPDVINGRWGVYKMDKPESMLFKELPGSFHMDSDPALEYHVGILYYLRHLYPDPFFPTGELFSTAQFAEHCGFVIKGSVGYLVFTTPDKKVDFVFYAPAYSPFVKGVIKYILAPLFLGIDP